MAATFSPGDATQTAGRFGFDSLASWAMVPEGGTKKVILTGGAGLALRPTTAGVVALSETSTTAGREIVITGSRLGTVRLEAQDSSGRAQATLEISVKRRRTISTFIHFVFDRSNRSTQLGLSDAVQMMDVVNKLLLPQANVMLSRRDSGGVNLPYEMERGLLLTANPYKALKSNQSWQRKIAGPLPCISRQPLGPAGCMPETVQGNLTQAEFDDIRSFNMIAGILTHLDPSSNYNLFFVSRFDEPPGAFTGAFSPTDPNGTILNACIVHAGVRGQGLAHELCHFLLNGATFLDSSGHSRGVNDLMKASPGQFDIFIPKNQANFINP